MQTNASALTATGQPAAPHESRHANQQAGKLKDAASQFEAMLVTQMMQSARGSWSSDDGENSTLRELSEQQFAQALALNGGFGIAKMVVTGLTNK